ncbi:hypothetical protein EYF80_054022 [Liparis tanakae]|uniref:Secreted protein n=1 Tax=Liparis tanakae TaxID=230148 RepID=A0A4Z2F3L4_9TELE|nr:hypothetical protein EYF80_054022 [Liparis tanakae]
MYVFGFFALQTMTSALGGLTGPRCPHKPSAVALDLLTPPRAYTLTCLQQVVVNDTLSFGCRANLVVSLARVVLMRLRLEEALHMLEFFFPKREGSSGQSTLRAPSPGNRDES